jgi:hypothetical protein
MTDQPPFAGIGKLYFCRVEDVEKDPKEDYFALDKPVSLLKPGMLTYKDDEPKSEYSAKGFSTTFTGTMEEPSQELLELLVTPPNRWDVKLEGRPGRMPRKMKKAYCYGWLYRRDTKWKRKAGNYRRRLLLTLHDAEIVVAKEQRDRLSDVLNVEMEIRMPKEITAKKPK